MIDLYCERVSPDFWAEPLNAVTNLAFIAAAVAAAVQARKDRRWDAGIALLSLTVSVIGGGSFAFHTLATPLANLFDVVPILIFQLLFLLFYPSRVLGWRRPQIAGAFAAYGGAIALAASLPQHWLNGSISYLPALLFLGLFGFVHRRRKLDEANILLVATGLFIASLIFRSLDNALCAAIPAGVHFLWHILNAGVLYLTMRAYWKNWRGQ